MKSPTKPIPTLTEAMKVTRVGDDIVVTGPERLSGSMTAEAARRSAHRLDRASRGEPPDEED